MNDSAVFGPKILKNLRLEAGLEGTFCGTRPRLRAFARRSGNQRISFGKGKFLGSLIEKRVPIPSGEEPTQVPHRRKKLLSLAC